MSLEATRSIFPVLAFPCVNKYINLCVLELNLFGRRVQGLLNVHISDFHKMAILPAVSLDANWTLWT